MGRAMNHLEAFLPDDAEVWGKWRIVDGGK